MWFWFRLIHFKKKNSNNKTNSVWCNGRILAVYMLFWHSTQMSCGPVTPKYVPHLWSLSYEIYYRQHFRLIWLFSLRSLFFSKKFSVPTSPITAVFQALAAILVNFYWRTFHPWLLQIYIQMIKSLMLLIEDF